MFKANEHISYLNAFREQLGSIPATEIDFRSALKHCGLPSNLVFWSEFKHSNIISKIGKDLYCFTEPDKPINYKKLEVIYKKYKKRSECYKNTWIANKNGNALFVRPDIIEAIKLLTDNGFEVIMRANNLIKQLISIYKYIQFISSLQILTKIYFEDILINAIFVIYLCGNSSIDRALAFQAGGCGFEPRFPL